VSDQQGPNAAENTIKYLGIYADFHKLNTANKPVHVTDSFKISQYQSKPSMTYLSAVGN